jgi:hypothetical protein
MNAMHFLDLLGLVMVGSGGSLPMPRYQQIHQPRCNDESAKPNQRTRLKPRSSGTLASSWVVGIVLTKSTGVLLALISLKRSMPQKPMAEKHPVQLR